MARKTESTRADPGPELPSKGPDRPVAYDRNPARYQIRFGRIPESIRIEENGKAVEIDNPAREVAVFVVHGIGEQADTETAVNLRRGIEDAIPFLQPRSSQNGEGKHWIVPPPYIFDGYWADYDRLERVWDKSELSVFTARQAKFFELVLRARAGSWPRNCTWIFKQGIKLMQASKGLSWLVYFPLTVFAALLYLLVAVPNLRNSLNAFVNDARLYLEPRGDIELETVQVIDYRVGEMFLKMLGLGWDFTALPKSRKLTINGEKHQFKHVIWVAHSLGTVISYNVIGDLFRRCEEIRRNFPGREHNVQKVETALRHFITIGSPLDKVWFLFGKNKNSVLRPWPEKCLCDQYLVRTYESKQIDANLANEIPRNGSVNVNFWLNFFYGSDPVSGSLENFQAKDKPIVKNISTRGLRWPVASHVAYWRDTAVVAKILELAYPGYVQRFEARYWPQKLHTFLCSTGIILLSSLTASALVAIWIYRADIWEVILKLLFGN